jgi:dTDP-4-amino-4,6-dideoxygalactose transaminase
VWQYYYQAFQPLAKQGGVVLPSVPEGCGHAAHLFYIILPSQEIRDRLIRFLRDKRIGSAFHYLPLHLSPMGRSFGYEEGDCPVTEDISGRLLRLPFHNRVTTKEQDRVVSSISEFLAQSIASELNNSPNL